jgi:hypothetical protein
MAVFILEPNKKIIVQKRLPLLFLATLCIAANAKAATDITSATVTGTWTTQGSPYQIYNDIEVPPGASLIIEPGVEVIFMGHYQMSVLGSIQAIGNAEQPIVFKASDTLNWNNFAISDGGWKGISISNFGTANNIPQFKYCSIRDLKALNYSGFTAGCNEIVIDNCSFYKNYSVGSVISISQFGNNVNSKLRFTNNILSNNAGNNIMYTLLTDSSIVTGNNFRTNTSKHAVYTRVSENDTSHHVLIFEDNELVGNTVSEDAAVFYSLSGGHDYFKRNKVSYNTTTLKAAVSINAYRAIIDGNLITNNTREQRAGFVCGINDGGAGLHLLGQSIITNQPNANIYTVSNNIIANNYSDINGAGIWAQHCKANIVNNTIVNNLSQDQGAAIHCWGGYSEILIQNNIIHGNRMIAADTGLNNFKFSPLMQSARIANNLIDYHWTNAPGNIIGLDTNLYDSNLALAGNTQGAGVGYDATVADFSPTAQSSNIIDQGTTTASGYGSLDYLGNNRVIGAGIDMGAIEYQASARIGNRNAEDYISIYPNPAVGELWLEHTGNNNIASIKMFQSNGREVFCTVNKNQRKYRLSFPNLNKGTYYLQVQTEEGTYIMKAFVNLD